MRKTISKDIIPLLISVLLLIITIGIILLSNTTLNYKHYVGIGLIGISSVLYFKDRKAYIYVFGLTLILGIINLVDIFHLNFSFGFGPIGFNPLFLALFFIFLNSNKKLLNKMFPKKELTETEIEEKRSENIKLIKNYERKFQSKTVSELKNISDEKSGYVNEAKTASKNILKNKNRL